MLPDLPPSITTAPPSDRKPAAYDDQLHEDGVLAYRYRGTVLTATRARSAKTYNLARDPRAMLRLFTERWPGPWLHVEGEASIERLPEAMPLLADYYRRRGQDTTTEAFHTRMVGEDRVLIRITPQRVVRRPTA